MAAIHHHAREAVLSGGLASLGKVVQRRVRSDQRVVDDLR